VAKPRRQNTRNSRLAAFPQNVPKALVYDALATLNQDFEQVLADLERLQGLRLFPRRWHHRVLKAWRAALEETRASVNFEVDEILHQREERDWVGFGRIRQRLEKPSEPPSPHRACSHRDTCILRLTRSCRRPPYDRGRHESEQRERLPV
jgi:hypothetical protein